MLLSWCSIIMFTTLQEVVIIMKTRGVVACGHQETAVAAQLVLREGGNAFDAVIAAFFTCCVVEPVLASLGGGGFLLSHAKGRRNLIYDFFAQTPQLPLPADKLDFYPIHADFGTTTQEFHIGLASIATPGAVKGIFRIHEDLCTMPIRELAQPAVEAARNGVVLNGLQASIFQIISPILTATPEARRVFESSVHPGLPVGEDETLRQPHLADFLEVLVREGSDLFYKGDMAQLIGDLCAHGGGQLTQQDLADYEVVLREPLGLYYRRRRVLTNPAPSCGGSLIAFALKLLEQTTPERYAFGSYQHLHLLADTMKLTNEARLAAQINMGDESGLNHLLDAKLLHEYREKIVSNAHALHGTTHISVMDDMGNVAALTASNGEGCGHMIPDAGVMLNNMLGEEDLNPDGFFEWQANRRMTSMMAPTLVTSTDGRRVCLGSGGSNRLRTAILQVLANIIDFGMPLQEAVNQPRIHFENDLLSIEPGFDTDVINALCGEYANQHSWRRQNLFFGGVHAVTEHHGKFDGAGDPRRGGVAIVVE